MSDWRMLVSQMQALDKLGDQEIAHSMGDDLLLDAIRYLARCDDITRPDPQDVEPLIAAWVALDKWYA